MDGLGSESCYGDDVPSHHCAVGALELFVQQGRSQLLSSHPVCVQLCSTAGSQGWRGAVLSSA